MEYYHNSVYINNKVLNIISDLRQYIKIIMLKKRNWVCMYV